MFVRRKVNKSGSISVHVVDKARGRYQIVKVFGPAENEQEAVQLENHARNYIRRAKGSIELFPEESDNSIEDFMSSVSNAQIQVAGPELIFGRLYDKIGYGEIRDEMFRHLVICRLFNPGSKLRTVDYLQRYLGVSCEVGRIYRFMDKLCIKGSDDAVGIKHLVEDISFRHTRKVVGGHIKVAFYDMTTLYFEAAEEDSLRIPGFNKDGKHSCPQIFLGLLVASQGNPIGYEIYEGNIFEGHTLIPMIEGLAARHGFSHPVVVADAGLTVNMYIVPKKNDRLGKVKLKWYTFRLSPREVNSCQLVGIIGFQVLGFVFQSRKAWDKSDIQQFNIFHYFCPNIYFHMQNQDYKYFAFISYNSKDTNWGKRLQKKLEHYRMPSTLCSERGWERIPIKPVFFAPTDIQPGGLSEELQERLKASRNLIVICSPNSAKSEWVGREIEFFHQLGRTKNIHFFIVDGQPHSGNPETECFNPVIEKLGLPEILGANINEKNYKQPWLNRERAYVQLISKLLGVEFDTIWQRHRRQLIRNTIAWTFGIIVVLMALICVGMMSKPVDVQVTLNETSPHNDQLPPMKDAVITIEMDDKTEVDTLHTIDGSLVFRHIDHKFLNKPVRVSVLCQNFLPIDTLLTLTKTLVLDIARDPAVFGDIRFRLYDTVTGQYLNGVTVNIDGHTVTSDADGCVALFIPLASQRKTYPLSADIPLHEDSVYLPCGDTYCIFKR